MPAPAPSLAAESAPRQAAVGPTVKTPTGTPPLLPRPSRLLAETAERREAATRCAHHNEGLLMAVRGLDPGLVLLLLAYSGALAGFLRGFPQSPIDVGRRLAHAAAQAHSRG